MRLFTAFLVFPLCTLFARLSINSSSSLSLQGVDVENPIINFTPSLVVGPSRGSKDTQTCERIRVSGKSRFKLGSYASAYRVTLVPSVVIPERLHTKIQICFHRNASFVPCQCENDNWKTVQKGLWNSVMSPYEDKYLDVKFIGEVPGSVTVAIEEEFQKWRIFSLALGFMLLLLAPTISSWVPFYYSSSMAIGVILVVIVLLFQGMKLIPTGRKNFFYLSIYTSFIGAGSYLLHYFSVMINSILLNFGLSEEMHNSVSITVLVLIVLTGAALGYWLVRKFVISEDGSVDLGVAQFVKWAIRIIGVTLVFLSTMDTSLAWTALGCWFMIWFVRPCIYITWKSREHLSYHGNGSSRVLNNRRATAKRTRAEFLTRPGRTGRHGTLWNSPRSSSKSIDSPVKGLVTPPIGSRNQQEFYSTFHKTPKRKKFSEQEWDDIKEDSTRQAVTELASTPEFADWIVKNADRIKVVPDETSEESLGSGSDSADEVAVESSNNGFGFNNSWQRRR